MPPNQISPFPSLLFLSLTPLQISPLTQKHHLHNSLQIFRPLNFQQIIMVGYRSIPQWLNALLKEEFFDPCLKHGGDKKPEKNLYCIDCSSSVCQSCVFRHRRHILLQVSRYVYNDVLKLSDAQKLMDCSGIQAYIANGAKVVFLKQRPVNRCYKAAQSSCLTCNRNLQDPFIFCCLFCKVKHTVTTGESLKINLSNYTMLGFSDVDEYQVTPDSVLDSPGSVPTSSGSTGTSDLWAALHCTATTEVVRKKRSNLSGNRGLNRVMACSQPAEYPIEGLVCVESIGVNRECICCLPAAAPKKDSVFVTSEPADHYVNRRKRVPNRSPLC